MIDFAHIKYGVLIAIISILFGGLMGLSFGCCEESIKMSLNSDANAALETKYQGDRAKLDKVVKKILDILQTRAFPFANHGCDCNCFLIADRLVEVSAPATTGNFLT